MVGKNRPNEVSITRIYDAPVKAVWDAWTDPAKAALWWGPRGHSIKTHSKELRAGGHWKYTMFGPKGEVWPNHTLYHEVVPLQRLVYDHGGNDDQPPLFKVTVTFSESKGKTTMEMTMAFPSADVVPGMKKFIKEARGNSTWDRLGEYLGKESSDKELFIINEVFEAPIEKMFEVWTKPEHLAKWIPPTGFTMKYQSADIRAGGKTSYSMTNGTITMYGRAEYSEVTRPSRLVYTQQFCDEKGNVSRHPMAPTWPETMKTVVTFAAESPTQTRVTIEWEVVGKVTAEEMATFIAGRSGMTEGWSGSFEKLEAYLS